MLFSTYDDGQLNMKLPKKKYKILTLQNNKKGKTALMSSFVCKVNYNFIEEEDNPSE